MGDGVAVMIKAGLLRPNPWNPNRMDADMFQKAMASIRQFGFVDPITVRELPVLFGEERPYEIVDGEHRWKAGCMDDWVLNPETGDRSLARAAMEVFPCWNLGELEDDIAQQLTIVLNETRGQADRSKLSDLVRELAKRRDERALRDVMPFSAERFNSMTGIGKADFAGLAERRKAATATKERLVERVYRLPRDVAEAWDDAIDKAKTEGCVSNEDAIETIAQSFLSS